MEPLGRDQQHHPLSPLASRLLDSLQRPDFLPHPCVHNLVLALDTRWSTFDTPVDTLGHNDLLLLGLFLALSGTGEHSSNLSSLFSITHLLAFHDTVSLLLGLLHPRHSLHPLSTLGLGDLLDGSGIQCPLSSTESISSLLSDRNIGLVKFGFVVKEPSGKAILVVSRETVEALVNEFVGSGFSINKSSSKRNSLGSKKTLICNKNKLPPSRRINNHNIPWIIFFLTSS